jgi:hypothetical protein
VLAGENLAPIADCRLMRWPLLLLLLSLLPMLHGCTRTVAERGLEPLWRGLPAEFLVRGVTTKAEILERLGPPSQVITEGRGEIFYYLHEEARTRGLVLIVYNRTETETRYDRAIFFFGADGVLQEYALSAPSEEER